ncbi:hypothetical protein FRC09_013966 [Ceratobasidium sp. 395]|nr:hypothetical protein FRC09_013966 [Ceratobasidium sp. 395]
MGARSHSRHHGGDGGRGSYSWWRSGAGGAGGTRVPPRVPWSNGHPDKRIFLHNLSSSYSDLYRRLGQLSDLEKSINCVEQAVDLTPDCNPDKSVRLNHLGDSYLDLYRRLGKLRDLDKSIICRERVVGLTADNHPDKDSRLSGLAVSYSDRYKRLGKLDDLDKSIRCAEQVIDLTPNGHPSRPAVLSNLGRLYLDLYQRLGDLEDSNKSISYNKQAVDLAPDSHPNKPGCLNNLGNSYLDLYLRLGRLGNLDKSINSQEQAVDLARDDHSDKPICLSSLGTSYVHLHKRLGRPSDLDRSMSCLVQAVNLTPDDHPAKYEYLNNLSGLLRDSYRQRGVLGDIEQSITALEQAICLMPDDHPNRFMPLHGLGNGYAMIFGHLSRIEDSSKAINYYSLALSLLPNASPYESGCLSELGAVYGVRFEAFGNMEDADQALTHLAKAERLCPDHDPGRTVRLINSGALHLDLFVRTEQRNHGLSAMNFYRTAAHVVGACASLRLNSSQKWAALAALFSSAPLEAYQYCMALLPQVVWLGTSVTDQHVAISRDVQDLVASAASMAILSQRYDLALEWLEQGHSIVWGQLLQLRTPLNELSDRCPKLAEELRQVSSGLERASTSSLFEQPLVAAGGLFRDTSGEHRRLAQRWEELLKSARALPGLEGFLLPPKSQEITSLVTEGVAVIINIKENQGCDVLIIQAKAPTISHVLLPSFSSQKAEQLHNELKSCLAAHGTRRGVRKTERKPDFSRILSLLWHEVVKPVIDHLGITYNPLLEDLPHITWCTTGPLSFLPLHAAGDYSHPSTALPYLAVSSYTPTIGAL